MTTNISPERIELERFKVGIKDIIPQSTFRQTLKLNTYTDELIQNLVLQLSGYVLAEEVDKREKVVTFEYKIPLNWWEHFKASILPIWLYRYVGQPKYKTITKERTIRFRKLATYPKANIAIPELGDIVIYRTQIEEE